MHAVRKLRLATVEQNRSFIACIMIPTSNRAVLSEDSTGSPAKADRVFAVSASRDGQQKEKAAPAMGTALIQYRFSSPTGMSGSVSFLVIARPFFIVEQILELLVGCGTLALSSFLKCLDHGVLVLLVVALFPLQLFGDACF